MADRVVGWTPDGKRVLFASSRESGRQRYSQFYTVGLDRRPAREAAGALRRVRDVLARRPQFVYMPMSQDFRTWKRYRGGWAPDLWLFDLKTKTREHHLERGNDAQPMWHGDTRLLPVGPRRQRAQQHLGATT
jgi:tricorn protease